MGLQCIVFDCDGVIMESVPVKTKAFGRMAEPYGEEARDRMLMYHKVNGGVNRLKKFEWFFREVLGREITPEELEDWGRRYKELAYEEVCRCDLVPGVQEVLDAWKGRVPMYVCSGAPHEELLAVLQGRGLAHYFTGIYGAPPAKSELLRRVLLEARVNPAETVMVGDAPTDQRAAEENETLFYGRGEEVQGGPWPWGEDLQGLNAWLEEQYTK